MGDITPKYRIEQFIDAIINGTTPPTPKYRAEFWLAKIAGANVVPPTPRSRFEKYLAKIAGENINIPTPKYRIEFWLAKLCGEDVSVPTPVTVIESWLKAWVDAKAQKVVSSITRLISVGLGIPLTRYAKGTPLRELTMFGETETDTTEDITVGGMTIPYYTITSSGRNLSLANGQATSTDPKVKIMFEGSDQYATVETLLSMDRYDEGIKDSHNILTGEVIRRCGVKVFDGSEVWEDTDDGPSITINGAMSGYSGPVWTSLGRFPNQTMPRFTISYPGISAAMLQQMIGYMALMGKPVFIVYPLETPITENVAPQQLTPPQNTSTVNIVSEMPSSNGNIFGQVAYDRIEEDLLPYYYKRRNYIKPRTPTAYLVLPYPPNTFDLEIQVDFKSDGVVQEQVVSLIGFSGDSGNCSWIFGKYAGKWYAKINGDVYNTTVATANRHMLTMKTDIDDDGDPVYSFSIDGETLVPETKATNFSSFLCNEENLYLFATNDEGSAKDNWQNCEVYGITIKQRGYYLADYIPVHYIYGADANGICNLLSGVDAHDSTDIIGG